VAAQVNPNSQGPPAKLSGIVWWDRALASSPSCRTDTLPHFVDCMGICAWAVPKLSRQSRARENSMSNTAARLLPRQRSHSAHYHVQSHYCHDEDGQSFTAEPVRTPSPLMPDRRPRRESTQRRTGLLSCLAECGACWAASQAVRPDHERDSRRTRRSMDLRGTPRFCQRHRCPEQERPPV
jgi:hypothetical protein